MQFMLAGAPWLVFIGAPSGSTYQANQNGIFSVPANNSADVAFLITSGCVPLTPFGAYTLPPLTGWKPAVTANGFPVGPSVSGSFNSMSCRVHYATQSLSGLIKGTLVNIYNLANVGDYWDALGSSGPQKMGPITVKGSICYPGPNNVVGTYTGILVNPGQMVDVQLALSATIPQGAKFYEGCWCQVASGCYPPGLGFTCVPSPAGSSPFPGNGFAPNVGIGEGVNASGTASDLTANLASLTGTVTGGANVAVYGFSVIGTVQPLSNPAILYNGDSLTAGFKGGSDTLNNYGPVGWACGDVVPYINVGVSGKPAGVDAIAGYSGTGFASAMSARLALGARWNCTHFFNCLGTNDLNGTGTSAATVEGYLVTEANLAIAQGMVCVTATLPPCTTSTDSWATVANQTVNTNEANRTAFNTAIRAGLSPYVAYMEFCTPCESSPGSGKWIAPGGTADGVHWGYNVEVAVASNAFTAVNGLTVATPAMAVAYYDTYGRGAKTVQAALDYLMNPNDLGKEVRLATATINANITTDQLITLPTTFNYVVTKVVVHDPSIGALSAVQGGIYTGAGKTGPLFGTGTTTPYTDVTNVGGAHVFGGGTCLKNPYLPGDYINLYFSFTTAQGAAATFTADVYGVNLAA